MLTMDGQSGSVVRTLAAITVACALSGCNPGGNAAVAQAAQCSMRVIVRFAAEPADTLLADLERTHTVELEPVATITNDLRVYTLRAIGSDDECAAAIERLRRDERVRSVDIDARREAHEQ